MSKPEVKSVWLFSPVHVVAFLCRCLVTLRIFSQGCRKSVACVAFHPTTSLRLSLLSQRPLRQPRVPHSPSASPITSPLLNKALLITEPPPPTSA
ncbi:hypothetical protein E2C01_034742 [Portunus trituberculatus]|uniref:Uncharacterized protein n=1 Tax=Portunus trituberculatus TaxID=210409 RepID=A0A5B7F6H5_PORTR|nr:hypothetical protein [Portunus trituberculatus]